MTQFVQVGQEAFNVAAVKNVRIYQTEEVCAVTIYLDPGVWTELTGDDARRFLRWWEKHADVYVCP